VFKQAFPVVFLALNILSSTARCHAALRDPTRPVYSNGKKITAAPVRSRPVLSAIRISSQSKWAVINGVSAKQGQTIADGIKIVKIRAKSVVIKQKDKIRELHLIGQHYKKY